MKRPRPVEPLDLSLWTSGELIFMFQEGNRQPAFDVLFERHWPATLALVAMLAHKEGLQEADRLDAQQEAFGWLRKAIGDYDTNQLGRTRGRGFHSYVWRRITDRFHNFARDLYRRASQALEFAAS